MLYVADIYKVLSEKKNAQKSAEKEVNPNKKNSISKQKSFLSTFSIFVTFFNIYPMNSICILYPHML